MSGDGGFVLVTVSACILISKEWKGWENWENQWLTDRLYSFDTGLSLVKHQTLSVFIAWLPGSQY